MTETGVKSESNDTRCAAGEKWSGLLGETGATQLEWIERDGGPARRCASGKDQRGKGGGRRPSAPRTPAEGSRRERATAAVASGQEGARLQTRRGAAGADPCVGVARRGGRGDRSRSLIECGPAGPSALREETHWSASRTSDLNLREVQVRSRRSPPLVAEPRPALCRPKARSDRPE